MNKILLLLALVFLLTTTLMGCHWNRIDAQRAVSVSTTGPLNKVLIIEKPPIALESSDESLISNIDSVTVCPAGQLLVGTSLMNRSSRVYLFSDHGGFLRQIGSSGQGPGEYGIVYDTTVTSDGLIALMETGRVQFFSKTGQPEIIAKHPLRPVQILPYLDEILAVCLHDGRSSAANSIIRMNRFGGKADGFLPKETAIVRGEPIYLPHRIADATNDHLTLLYCYRMGFRRVTLGPNTVESIIFEDDSCDENRALRDYLENTASNEFNTQHFIELGQKMARFDYVFDFDDQVILIHARDKSIYSVKMNDLSCERIPINLWSEDNPTGLKVTGKGFVGKTDDALICVCDDYEYVNRHYERYGFKEPPQLDSLSNPILFFLKLKKGDVDGE